MWRLSSSYAFSATELDLSNDEEAEVERRAVSLALERRLGDSWALQVGLGASLGGDVVVGEDRYELSPGWMAMVAGSFRVLDGLEYKPFVLLSLAGAVGGSQTEHQDRDEEASYTALDVRFSVMVGKLFWNVMGPYVVARAFGGPVFWERHGEDVQGSDQHFFQVGGGIVTSSGLVDAYVEVVPLGERSATFGASVMF